jgi:serine/threonine protein kinase
MIYVPILDNILMDINPDLTFNCVICDFGFANFTLESQRSCVAGFSKPTTIGITYKYAAPEVSQPVMEMITLFYHGILVVYETWSKSSFE